ALVTLFVTPRRRERRAQLVLAKVARAQQRRGAEERRAFDFPPRLPWAEGRLGFRQLEETFHPFEIGSGRRLGMIGDEPPEEPGRRGCVRLETDRGVANDDHRVLM